MTQWNEDEAERRLMVAYETECDSCEVADLATRELHQAIAEVRRLRMENESLRARPHYRTHVRNAA